MADRFPLILNTNANQIQEIASGDSLDLTGSNVKGVGILTAGNVTVGAATTDLVVTGDARITGILTVGTSSLKLDGPNNLVNVGTALTLGHTQGLQFHTQNLHSAGFEVNQINVSGASTIGGNLDANGDLDVDGHTNLDNVNIAGVTTTTENIHIKADNKRIFVGASDDISMYNDGSSSRITNQSGQLIIKSPILTVQDSGNRNQIIVRDNAQVDLYYNGTGPKFQTASSGVNVSGTTTTTGLSVTGVSTFTGAIDANGDLDVDGHTNLDNVSITGMTTTNQINISSSGPKITFSDTNENPDFYIEVNASQFLIQDATANAQRFRIQSNGIVDIPGNTNFSAGIDVTGNATVSGNLSVGGVLTYEDVTNVDSVGIITARNGVSVTSGGIKVLAGVSNFNANIVGTATTALSVTAADESSDTSCNVLFATTATGNVAPKTGTNLTFNSSSGALTATSFVGGGSGLTSLSGSVIASALSGQDVSGLGNVGLNATLTARNGVFNDNGGASPTVMISTDDGSPWAIQIKNDQYWNSTSNGWKCYQDNGGNFYQTVQGNGAFINHYIQTINGGTTNTAIHIDTNRAVHLNYQNGNRLSTTTNGATITDSVKVNGSSNGGQTVVVSSGSARGSTIGVTNTSAAGIFWSTGDGYGIYKTAGAWSGNYQQLTIEWITGIHLNGGTSYGLSGVRFSSHALPTANNTYDLGTSSLRWRNIYTNDLNLSNEGSKNDVDGTWGNYTIQEGESDLFLINKRSGKKYKFNLTEVN